MEENIKTIQQTKAVEVYRAVRSFPYFVLNGLDQQSMYRKELLKIVEFYNVYKKGASFIPQGNLKDFPHSVIRYKKIKDLIDKEARYMYAEQPDISFVGLREGEEQEETLQIYQTILNKVFERSSFQKKLLQSAKDCFIGKRIAILVEFSEKKGALIQFFNSRQFYYEKQIGTESDLKRFVTFKTEVESDSGNERRVLVNDYKLIGEFVYMSSTLYDGVGNVIEELIKEHKTELLEIPAVVVTNEGTLEDEKGVSEVEDLEDRESGISFLNNADIDCLKSGMNPIRYTVDMDSYSTENLSASAGSYWDLHSDQNIDDKHPSVGTLSPDLRHSEPIKGTLERLNISMHNAVDVPDITSETLQGVITSGKGIEALYFPLTTRCNEKMKTWVPALKFVVRTVIDIVVLNKELCEEIYSVEDIQKALYDIEIKPNYALLTDKEAAQRLDMEEVANNIRSRLSYNKKWRPDELKNQEQNEEELIQIATELNMFDTMSENSLVQNRLNDEEEEEQVEKDLERIKIEEQV